MKQEFKTLLLLVMLTFLSVNCGSDSSSGDGDDAELPPFTASESVDGADGEQMSVFERLVKANEAGSDIEDHSGVASPDDLQGQPVTTGKPMSCIEDCE